jgi:hypothetical protein
MPSRMRRRHGGDATSLVALLGILLTVSVAPASARLTNHRHAGALTVSRSTDRRKPTRSALAHAAVIGGKSAETGTFPWLAYIADFKGEEEVDLCTGTVVASNLVLTAAHCAENIETGVLDEPAAYRVVTGNVDWTAAPRQISGVSRVVVYPGFNRNDLTGDAALLVLSTPNTEPAIALASYPSDAHLLEAGTAAVIAGWGKTYSEQETLTERLQWAGTAVQGPAYCEENAPPFYEGSEICTINPPSYETGVCFGDSGGPLIALNPDGSGFVELGVTSHLYGECLTSRPSVFTRADIIASWVHEWAEAVKPPPTPPPVSSPTPTPAPAPAAPPQKVTPAPVVAATKAPAPPPVEGVYRGTTSQPSTPISLVVGSGGHRVTAVATKIVYHCRSGHTITEPLEGLSNGESEPITASHTFTIAFSGAESESITGAIDVADGEMSGTLAAKATSHGPHSAQLQRLRWLPWRLRAPTTAGPIKIDTYWSWLRPTADNSPILNSLRHTSARDTTAFT